MNIEQIAAVVHEANRVYCLSLGDESQPHWEDAPDWQRQSAIEGVRHVAANLSATPRQAHGVWLSSKRDAGWTYGAVKDVGRKQHPCMVPYDELPAEQREKDHIFINVVKALLP